MEFGPNEFSIKSRNYIGGEVLENNLEKNQTFFSNKKMSFNNNILLVSKIHAFI